METKEMKSILIYH